MVLDCVGILAPCVANAYRSRYSRQVMVSSCWGVHAVQAREVFWLVSLQFQHTTLDVISEHGVGISTAE